MMKQLQADIWVWAKATFGDHPLNGIAIRGNKEMAELLSGFSNGASPAHLAEECADVAFFLLQVCEGLGYDLEEEIAKKFEKNKLRSWEKAKDGSFQHKKEETDAA